MEQTKLVIMIYEEGLRPDVEGILKAQGLLNQTVWQDVRGQGVTGPKHGDPIWPGLNDVLFMAVPESAVAPLVEEMHKLRDSLPIVPGMRFIITDAVFI